MYVRMRIRQRDFLALGRREHQRCEGANSVTNVTGILGPMGRLALRPLWTLLQAMLG